MKKISLLLLSVFFVQLANASNLLPYIEMPVTTAQVSTFNDQTISFKACEHCQTVNLAATTAVEYLENGQAIDFQRALEIYLTQTYSHVSIFYLRSSLVYDRVSFGSYEAYVVEQAQKSNAAVQQVKL